MPNRFPGDDKFDGRPPNLLSRYVFQNFAWHSFS